MWIVFRVHSKGIYVHVHIYKYFHAPCLAYGWICLTFFFLLKFAFSCNSMLDGLMFLWSLSNKVHRCKYFCFMWEEFGKWSLNARLLFLDVYMRDTLKHSNFVSEYKCARIGTQKKPTSTSSSSRKKTTKEVSTIKSIPNNVRKSI